MQGAGCKGDTSGTLSDLKWQVTVKHKRIDICEFSRFTNLRCRLLVRLAYFGGKNSLFHLEEFLAWTEGATPTLVHGHISSPPERRYRCPTHTAFVCVKLRHQNSLWIAQVLLLNASRCHSAPIALREIDICELLILRPRTWGELIYLPASRVDAIGESKMSARALSQGAS